MKNNKTFLVESNTTYKQRKQTKRNARVFNVEEKKNKTKNNYRIADVFSHTQIKKN